MHQLPNGVMPVLEYVHGQQCSKYCKFSTMDGKAEKTETQITAQEMDQQGATCSGNI